MIKKENEEQEIRNKKAWGREHGAWKPDRHATLNFELETWNLEQIVNRK